MSDGPPTSIRTSIGTAAGPIAALQCGTDTGGTRTAVLLVPGYTGSKEDFAPLLPLLADAGIAATAIDLPGQFESPGPADPLAYSPDRLAAVVLDIAHQLGPQVQLVGHSFGGLVARAAVIAEPGAFGTLTLLCSGPAALGGDRAALIGAMAPLLAASGLAAVYAATQAVYRAQPGYVEPPAAAAAFLERRFLAGVPAMLAGMGQALTGEPDRVDELAAVAPRTLVLHGVDDEAWPPAAQALMAQRLGAELVVIEGAAHSPAVENPEPTAAALLAFWRGA